jgi:large subunit ribosomal protein L10
MGFSESRDVHGLQRYKEMAQSWKVERLEKLKDDIKRHSSFIFTDYRGLNVNQLSSLRSALKNKEVEYHVVKNRFAKRAFKELGYEDIDPFFIDPTAIAYFNVDISEVCKVLIDSAEETTLQMKGALSDGVFMTSQDIEKISKLPSKQILIAKTVGLMASPVTGLVFMMKGMLTQFVGTLKQIEKIKGSDSKN